MDKNQSDFIRTASRSIWRERFTKNFSFYCPLCAVPRRIGLHPKPGQPVHFAQVGVTTLFIAALSVEFFPWIGWKALVAFIPLWMLFETVYRAKVRASVACRQCGFDPFLYLTGIARARGAVREHWKKKFEEKGLPFPDEGLPNNASHFQGGAVKRRAPSVQTLKKHGKSPARSRSVDSLEK